jgi:hypothetical protein
MFSLSFIKISSDIGMKYPKRLRWDTLLHAGAQAMIKDILAVTQRIIAVILVSVRERNDTWVTLATRVFGLARPSGQHCSWR